MSISTSLHRAAKLQEKIDVLREQMAVLIEKARAEISSAPALDLPAPTRRGRGPGRPKGAKGSKSSPKVKASVAPVAEPAKRGRQPKKLDGRSKAARALKAAGQSPLAGRRRSSSPSGPLAPAVVKVLAAKGAPMNVRDILTDLLASGYKFNTPEPKKNLAARVYRLKGVKQVGEGLFATA